MVHLSIQLKQLNYDVDSNYTPVKFLSNWWNFKLTVFQLTMHYKHEMIGICQRFHRKFELSGTSN